LIYSNQFSLEEAVEYIQNYLEKKGDEIKSTKEKFNELLNKEDLNKEDLKKFQKYIQLNNKKGISY
jgi:predicted HTH domain antitoxin